MLALVAFVAGAIRARLLEARERDLRSLVADWEPEGPGVDRMIARLADELAHQQALAA